MKQGIGKRWMGSFPSLSIDLSRKLFLFELVVIFNDRWLLKWQLAIVIGSVQDIQQSIEQLQITGEPNYVILTELPPT